MIFLLKITTFLLYVKEIYIFVNNLFVFFLHLHLGMVYLEFKIGLGFVFGLRFWLDEGFRLQLV